MKIEIHILGDVHILDCGGPIMLGKGTMTIRNTVRNISKHGAQKIGSTLPEQVISIARALAN
jgi:hypothetical protein